MWLASLVWPRRLSGYCGRDVRDQVIEDVELKDAALTRGRALADEVTISLIETVRRIVAGRWLLLLCSVAGLLLGVGLALSTPPWYRAEAMFLPPETPDLGSSTSPTAAMLLKQDPTDIYLGLLASRSVADDVIDHVGLMKSFHAQLRTDARAALGGVSKFTVSKNQLISVQVKMGDPVLAAAVANAYLDALYRLNGQMVSSSSSHREQFFEGQLAEQKEILARAETELKTTQERTGIVSPEGEAQAGLSATSQLQADIAAAQTRLAGLRAGATEQNPQVIEARSQLAELQGLLAQVQASSGVRRPGAGIASTRELPGLTLEYARKLRELKLRESIYNGLTQQYERARLAAIDPGPQLQIVDRAIVAERKSGPSRRLYVAGGGAMGFFAGLAYLMLSGPLRRLHGRYKLYPDAKGRA